MKFKKYENINNEVIGNQGSIKLKLILFQFIKTKKKEFKVSMKLI